jgi:hypothetical protein
LAVPFFVAAGFGAAFRAAAASVAVDARRERLGWVEEVVVSPVGVVAVVVVVD